MWILEHMYINILTDGSYLIQKKFFCLHLIEQQDTKIHGCWFWKLVNTKSKFHCDKNSNVKKNRKLFKINIKNNHNVDSLTQANNL